MFYIILSMVIALILVFGVYASYKMHQRQEENINRRILEAARIRREREREEINRVLDREPFNVVTIPGPIRPLTKKNQIKADKLISKVIKNRDIHRQAIAVRKIQNLAKRREILGPEFKLEIPYKTLYVGTFYEKLVEVREYEPTERTIYVAGPQDDVKNPIAYKLNFPHCIFMWKYSNVREKYFLYLGFSPKSIQDLKSKVYFPPLPNIHKSFAVCTPQGANLTETIDSFWCSVFRPSEIRTGPETLQKTFGLDFYASLKKWSKTKLPEFNNLLKHDVVSIKSFVDCRNFKIERVQ